MKKMLVMILFSFILLSFTYSYGDEHQVMDKGTMEKGAGFGICLVTKESASEQISYVYQGKTYYFCCPSCLGEFKKNPQKYISKIKEIKLVAFQFGYSPDPVVVKKGDIVSLDITSRDVTHGIFIKEYGINISVKKGEEKIIEFFADKEGKFDIICNVFCGPGHSTMRGKLIVGK